jgi:NitT/TauT family transport system ATP-binding protein
MASVKIQQIHQIWGDLEAEHVVALRDISFEIRHNEFLCILGPSGSGKSTLLHIIGALEGLTAGSVSFEHISDPARPRSNLVFQDFALMPWKNVLDNATLGLKLRGVPREQRDQIGMEYLHLLGLRGFERKYPHQLSGGMKQRVAIARVLANDPEVILMDEPFASVDAQTRIVLQEELLRIWEQKRKTVCFVTHSIDEAIILGDRIVVMTAGPGRVKEIIDIDLPRPRHAETRTSPAFVTLYDHCWRLIREEVEQVPRVLGTS